MEIHEDSFPDEVICLERSARTLDLTHNKLAIALISQASDSYLSSQFKHKNKSLRENVQQIYLKEKHCFFLLTWLQRKIISWKHHRLYCFTKTLTPNPEMCYLQFKGCANLHKSVIDLILLLAIGNWVAQMPLNLLRECKSLQNIALHGNPISMDQFQQVKFAEVGWNCVSFDFDEKALLLLILHESFSSLSTVYHGLYALTWRNRESHIRYVTGIGMSTSFMIWLQSIKRQTSLESPTNLKTFIKEYFLEKKFPRDMMYEMRIHEVKDTQEDESMELNAMKIAREGDLSLREIKKMKKTSTKAKSTRYSSLPPRVATRNSKAKHANCQG
ncbi:hypothetical protein RND71_026428 [Anisodus tanguticus]|uniref:Uncharacterized protein n=1 Tax=Anisodus tanguticus TaxID=243964 RepID=A0AAE1VAH6_9SOLA|nr:hypothetical protein RND71_026428 [Anisodus tanguticus]